MAVEEAGVSHKRQLEESQSTEVCQRLKKWCAREWSVDCENDKVIECQLIAAAEQNLKYNSETLQDKKKHHGFYHQ